MLMLDMLKAFESHVEYYKSINADARAGEGFEFRQATHHKRTNQHSTQNPVRK